MAVMTRQGGAAIHGPRQSRFQPRTWARLHVIAWPAALLGLLLAAATPQSVRAQEAMADSTTAEPATADKPKDRFKEVQYPVYKDGRLRCLLRANTATAESLLDTQPRVNLQKVHIEIFQEPNESQPAMAIGGSLPVSVEITSDRGVYRKQPRSTPEGVILEDLASLHENVLVKRFKPMPDPDGKPILDLLIDCDNANWNNNRQILLGTGHVELTQDETKTTLEGYDYVYLMNPAAARGAAAEGDLPVKLSPDRLSQASGIIEIKRNVIMRSQGATGPGQTRIVTTVDCQGPANYDIDEREAFFENNVTVTRGNMRLDSDRLKVYLGQEPAPVQDVREIVAWSEARNLVRIKGMISRPGEGVRANEQLIPFEARGSYARFNNRTGEVILEDKHPKRLPYITYEGHEIRDVNIRLNKENRTLYTSGGQGDARFLFAIREEGEQASGAPTPTDVTYTKELFYAGERNFALFTGDVRLKNEQLQLSADSLRIDFVPGKARESGEADPSTVRKVTAEGNVVLVHAGKIGKGQRMELHPIPPSQRVPVDSGHLKGLIPLDRLIMFGPPSPQIALPGGGYCQAQEIVITRYARPNSDVEVRIIEAKGPGSGVFNTRYGKETAEDRVLPQDKPGANAGSITISYAKRMTYDETIELVRFEGNVQATNEDQVLRSDELQVKMVQMQDLTPGAKQENNKRIKKLSAIGNARLHWGDRHCEGWRIDRWLPQTEEQRVHDKVILTGSRTQRAKVYEENGPVFNAPIIVAHANGGRISAHGGGELVVDDEESGDRARITYRGTAIYTGQQDGGGQVTFNKDVVLRRGEMTVYGDQMVATMANNPGAAQDASRVEATETSMLPKKLRQVTITGRVRIIEGGREARGFLGRVDITPAGDILTLEGSRRGARTTLAEVQDDDGFRLRAPTIQVTQASGIVKAAGPGTVFLTSIQRLQSSDQGASIPTSGQQRRYRMNYDGQLVYNSLARKIRVERNVVLSGEELNGSCDGLLIMLKGVTGLQEAAEGTTQLEVEKIMAEGHVEFRSVQPPAEGEQGGKTIWTRSDIAVYHVTRYALSLSTNKRRPQVMREEIVARNGVPVPVRVIEVADRFWVFTDGSKEVQGIGSPVIDRLPPTGPLAWPDENYW